MLAAMASEALLDPRGWTDVGAYLAPSLGEPAFDARIHPADEMYRFALAATPHSREAAAIVYFSAARSIFRTVSALAAWRFGGWTGVRSFLDFAAGYGRATRLFAAALGPERVTAAEIDPAAVRFQREALGVKGRVSDADPGRLDVPTGQDLVVATSFFSHLPPERYGTWLARLYALVADGGLLVFSTHGPELRPPGIEMPEAGAAFRPESETARLSGDEYGTSWVTEEHVRDACARAGLGTARLYALARGLCGHQDLYVIARPPTPDGAPPRPPRDPLGAVMRASVDRGRVSAAGWVQGDAGEPPPEVRLYLGDRLEALSRGERAAGGRADWSFAFPAAALDPDRVVRIEAESSRGARRVFVAETLRPYVAAATVASAP
jgi:SAM-dependent methyltransferase